MKKTIVALNPCAKAVLNGKPSPEIAVKTLKVRIKDRHARVLLRLSRMVNTAWNHINEQTAKGWRDRRDWLSGFDACGLLNGMTNIEGWEEIAQTTFQLVAKEHGIRRNQFKKSRLSWRVSDPKKRNYSLGWVPFRAQAVRSVGENLGYKKFIFQILEDGYDLSCVQFRDGCFNEDRRGRWWANIPVRVDVDVKRSGEIIGIDPGRMDVMTTSRGDKLSRGDLQYPDLEDKLAMAQRSKKTGQRMGSVKRKRVQSLHAKIHNKRKHAQQAFVNMIADQASAVFIGHWAPPSHGEHAGAKLSRDASLATLKTMLANKCEERGIPMFEINEAWTSKACNECGAVKDEMKLDERQWTCAHCGAELDRDVNAAMNIRAAGEKLLADHLRQLSLREAA